MPTRRSKSQERRRAYHQARLDAAADDRSRLWAACNALGAAARRHRRLNDAKDAVLALVEKIEKGEQL